MMLFGSSALLMDLMTFMYSSDTTVRMYFFPFVSDAVLAGNPSAQTCREFVELLKYDGKLFLPFFVGPIGGRGDPRVEIAVTGVSVARDHHTKLYGKYFELRDDLRNRRRRNNNILTTLAF